MKNYISQLIHSCVCVCEFLLLLQLNQRENEEIEGETEIYAKKFASRFCCLRLHLNYSKFIFYANSSLTHTHTS